MQNLMTLTASMVESLGKTFMTYIGHERLESHILISLSTARFKKQKKAASDLYPSDVFSPLKILACPYSIG